MKMESCEELRVPFFVLASRQQGRVENETLVGSEVKWFRSRSDAHSLAMSLKDRWAWVDVCQMLGGPDEKGLYSSGKHEQLERYRKGRSENPL